MSEDRLLDRTTQRFLGGAGGGLLFLAGLFAAAGLDGRRGDAGFVLALLGLGLAAWQLKRGLDDYERGRGRPRPRRGAQSRA